MSPSVLRRSQFTKRVEKFTCLYKKTRVNVFIRSLLLWKRCLQDQALRIYVNFVKCKIPTYSCIIRRPLITLYWRRPKRPSNAIATLQVRRKFERTFKGRKRVCRRLWGRSLIIEMLRISERSDSLVSPPVTPCLKTAQDNKDRWRLR